jgi:hypothetical protein
VSPILGIYASQISGHLFAPSGAYDSIATVTASGSATFIDFTSIPSTYKHLQIRYIARSGVAASEVSLLSSLNGDNGSNYSWHNINANGSTVAASASSTTTFLNYAAITGASTTANTYGVGVIDYLDYANTSKYKTIRTLAGWDGNGSGSIAFSSGLWQSTSAVTSIRLATGAGNLTSLSTFALYGIKG